MQRTKDDGGWTMRTGLGALALAAATTAWAQGPGGGPPRRAPRAHTVTASAGAPRLAPADRRPPGASEVSIEVVGDRRVIRTNGLPAHGVGPFPGPGNPNPIAPQERELRVPAEPEPAGRVTPLGMHDFGVAVNGVPFDPGAAEWYLGDRAGGWQYEPLSGALALGLDASHAHVQPTGAYHYHGLPTLLLEELGVAPDAHSPLVGWAADGFPIYALYGHADPDDPTSPVRALRPSYRLKEGDRPDGEGQPGGAHDGTFVADHEYVAGLGDLDECNGRFGVTPEFPDGTYAYFLTEAWPVVPRAYRGTPSTDFLRRPPPGGSRPARRR